MDSPPLLGLMSAAMISMTDELEARLHAAGFEDHRRAFHGVMPHVPAEGIRMVELAERARMTKQAMSELVIDLERLGYLERRPDPTDGRARIIVLADKGWAAVRCVLAAFAEMEAELVERIGPRRFAELRKGLAAIPR